MVMMIAAIALSVMATLLYIIGVSSKMTGMEKRYETALEAGEGSEAVVAELIGSRAIVNTSAVITGIDYAFNNTGPTPLSAGCSQAKMLFDTSDWAASGCTASNMSAIVNTTSYDFRFTLGASPQTFTVYAKITDTVEGNSAGDIGLVKEGVVTSSPEVPVPSRPYIYSIEVSSVNDNNRNEQARVSILYEY